MKQKDGGFSPGRMAVKKLFQNKLSCTGFGILGVILLFCLAGPMLSPYDEYEIFYINNDTGEEVRMWEEDVGASCMGVHIKAPVSGSHWLGTDGDGRDVLTRLMYGGRMSLLAAVMVVIIELLAGVLLGGVAGYCRGIVDMIIMRLVEICYSIPFIPMMLIVSAVMFAAEVLPQHRIFWMVGVMGLLKWAGVARMIRGQVLSLREMEFMKAAEAAGSGTFRKIIRHLVPHLMPTIVLIATMDIGNVILLESVLSYLGVGTAWPYASWGNMVDAVNDSVILRDYMNIWLPPGICILLTVLAFHFIGDGLRDALDPRESPNRRKHKKQKRRKKGKSAARMRQSDNVLEVEHLKTCFETENGVIKAVDGVSFSVSQGKTVGLVGESGCGKSVTALSVMQLLAETRGEIRFKQPGGNVIDLAKADQKELEKIRGNDISIIFQEPMNSLNPVFSVGVQLCECILRHNPHWKKKEAENKALKMLKMAGIAREDILTTYPHQLSGGMCQRVLIAMALACEPRLIIADEPTTSLDVTIQAQILELLGEVKSSIGSSVLLITHDLGVVAEIADFVVVMYAGRIVEQGTAAEIFYHPLHPYTIGMMKAGSLPNKKEERLYFIPGNVPMAGRLSMGCNFKSRCECCLDICNEEYPMETSVTDTHKVSCHLWEQSHKK